MEIRFISSITPDEEVQLASALMDLIGPLLDRLPIAYLLRVDVGGGTTFERTHPTNPMARQCAPRGAAGRPRGLEP